MIVIERTSRTRERTFNLEIHCSGVMNAVCHPFNRIVNRGDNEIECGNIDELLALVSTYLEDLSNSEQGPYQSGFNPNIVPPEIFPMLSCRDESLLLPRSNSYRRRNDSRNSPASYGPLHKTTDVNLATILT